MTESLNLMQIYRPLLPYSIKSNKKENIHGPFNWKDTWRWVYNKFPYLLLFGVVLIIILILTLDHNDVGANVPFIEPGTIFDYSEFEDYPPGLREKLQAVANKTRKLSQKQNYGEHSNPQEKNALNLNNQNFVPDVKEHLGSFKNRNHVIGRDFVRRKGNHLGRPIIDEFGQTLALRPDLQGQNTKENHQPATAGRRRRDNASNWLLETSTGDPGISTGHAGTGIRDTRARTGSGGTGTGGAGVGTGGAGVGTAGAGIGTGYAGIGVGDSNNLKTNGDENAIDVHKNRHGCLPSCPLTPPNLKGRQAVITAATEEQVLRVAATSGVLEGGCWSPRYCTARYTVAIIVPVRDRKEQEWAFLLHMHPFLQRQQLNYTIFIVEQTKGSLFNRAKLLNVGFLTATQTTTYDCVVFHDVDMLPEDDHHLYHCSTMPRHLVVASSNNDYRSALGFQRNKYFGGACMMTPPHVWQVNGWSNRYWGWGGEDDDMFRRVGRHDLPVWRWPADVARYTMLPHPPPPGINEDSYGLLSKLSPFHRQDGLNSLHFTMVNSTRFPHHTRLLVDVGAPHDDPPLKRKLRSTRGPLTTTTTTTPSFDGMRL